MIASKENPLYTVYLVDGSTKYNLTAAVISINLSDQENQMAQSASIKIVNIMANKQKLSDLIKARQRVFIYANDGDKNEEVFRGWVWTILGIQDTGGNDLEIKAYDNLIYLQESDDSQYFAKGKKTSTVMQSICKSWGISLNYTYKSITHDKLVLRGTLSNIITSDILDVVKDRTGKKYVVISKKDIMYVSAVGSNATIYNIAAKSNVIRVRSEQSMDGMITKVKVLGSANKKTKKLPVKATVTGNTSKYGTLQKLIDKTDDISLSDAKKQAQYMIDDKGSPSNSYIVETSDIPWIRKGDLVYLKSDDISGYFITKSIDRDISNKSKMMTLTIEEPKDATIAPVIKKKSTSKKKASIKSTKK